MKKKIEARNYFIDIGGLSVIAIFGFSIGVKGLLPVIVMGIYTLLIVFGTVHLENMGHK